MQTEFFKDVKSYVYAGMQFGSDKYKIRKVGYDMIRLYYDSKEMDCLIGEKRIKRVFYDK